MPLALVAVPHLWNASSRREASSALFKGKKVGNALHRLASLNKSSASSIAAAPTPPAQPAVLKEHVPCEAKVETLPFAFNIWEAHERMLEQAEIMTRQVNGDTVSGLRRKLDGVSSIFGLPIPQAPSIRPKLLRLEAIYLPTWAGFCNFSIEASSKHLVDGHTQTFTAETTISISNARFPGCYWPPIHTLPAMPPSPRVVSYEIFNRKRHIAGPAKNSDNRDRNKEYEGLEGLGKEKEPEAIVVPFGFSPMSLLDKLHEADPKVTTVRVPLNLHKAKERLEAAIEQELHDDAIQLDDLEMSAISFKGSTTQTDMLALMPLLQPFYVGVFETAPDGPSRVIALPAWTESFPAYFHGFLTPESEAYTPEKARRWLGLLNWRALDEVLPHFFPRVPLPVQERDSGPSEPRERRARLQEEIESLWGEHTDESYAKQDILRAKRSQATNDMFEEETEKARREQLAASLLVGLEMSKMGEKIIAAMDWDGLRKRDLERAEYRKQGLLNLAEDEEKGLGKLDWHDRRIQRYSETYEDNLAYSQAVRRHSDRKVDIAVDELVSTREGLSNLVYSSKEGDHHTARDLLHKAWLEKRDATPEWLKSWREENITPRGVQCH